MSVRGAPLTSPRPGSARLGTFAGVFTPSILTILGLILFRRLGYVVGGAGLAYALLIMLFANSISLLTSMSLSAIATNLRVKGGGDYYLISRSLGVEYGGALGIVLFLAQSISVAFYLLGFGEAMNELYPPVSGQVFAIAATLFLFVFAWLGADWATRIQYVVMAALAAGLLSFAIGGIEQFSPATLRANWLPGGADAPDFWILFALFFPAVTGFTQGVSMSGDLRDPGRSLPAGTFAAVGLSIVVYVGAAVIFAGALPRAELVNAYDSMGRVAWLPALIAAGLVAATISSALASFLGAPRILQALAADRVFPPLGLFARGHGPANNPRHAVLLTLVIALAVTAVGGINVIAPVVSMFFLISYGLLNYATALEARANSPSFRPRFRWFHYRASLAGAAACFGLMVMISPWASAIAVAILFAIHQYIGRLSVPARWADSRRDHQFQAVRANLHAMAGEPVHSRSWRPIVLAFSDDPPRRQRLVRFAEWIEGGTGVTTVVRILRGAASELVDERRAATLELAAELDQHDLGAFPLVVAAPDVGEGAEALVQAYGVGPLKANTVLLNWIDRKPEGTGGEASSIEAMYTRQLRTAHTLGLNAIVLNATDEGWARVKRPRASDRRIDLWWFGDNKSSHLMILLTHLMTRTRHWEDTPVRLLAAAARRRPSERQRAEWQDLLDDYRMDVDLELVSQLDRATLIEQSRDAAIVFLPLRCARGRTVDPFGQPIEPLLDGLPVVAFVSAAEDIALDEEPEGGDVGRLAELEDGLRLANEEAKQHETELAAVTEQLEAARRKLREAETAEAGDGDDQTRRTAAARVAELQADVDRLTQVTETHRERVDEAQAARDAFAEETGATPARDRVGSATDPLVQPKERQR